MDIENYPFISIFLFYWSNLWQPLAISLFNQGCVHWAMRERLQKSQAFWKPAAPSSEENQRLQLHIPNPSGAGNAMGSGALEHPRMRPPNWNTLLSNMFKELKWQPLAISLFNQGCVHWAMRERLQKSQAFWKPAAPSSEENQRLQLHIPNPF